MAISCPGAQNHACPNLHMAIWAGQLILVNHRHLNLPSTHYTETCTRITTFNYGSNSVTKQCYKLRTPYPRFTPVKRYSMIHLKKEYFSPLCWLWPPLIFLPAFCTHATLSLHNLCTFAGFLDACPNAFSTVNFSLPVGGRKIQLFATKCRRVHSLSLSRKFRSATKLPYMHTLRLLRVVINLEPQTLESGNRQTCSFRDPYRFNFCRRLAQSRIFIRIFTVSPASNPSDSHIICWWNEILERDNPATLSNVVGQYKCRLVFFPADFPAHGIRSRWLSVMPVVRHQH